MANLKKGFNFEQNKEEIDQKMKKAFNKYPTLTMVKLSTTKQQFGKSASNEKFTRENYIITKIKRPYLAKEPVSFKVSSQNGIELK